MAAGYGIILHRIRALPSSSRALLGVLTALYPVLCQVCLKRLKGTAALYLKGGCQDQWQLYVTGLYVT